MVDVATLRRRIDALERATSPGGHGRVAANQRADALDAWFAESLASARAPAGVALVALGGYGRRLQLPCSDIDVLLLHDGTADDELAALGERLWYPLWDGGWSVTPLVRTAAECLRAANERLDTLTAMLDARPVAGNRGDVQRAIDPVRDLVRADPPGLAARLRGERERRRERFGSCAHDLAPDLKEGVGGLRDIASLGWLAAAVESPRHGSGLLRASETMAVDAAEEFLVRARSEVHLETGKRGDRLTVDLQPEVAKALGFVDEPDLPAIDGLMRALFEHARSVTAVVTAVTERLSRGDAAAGELVELGGPADALDALATAAANGTPIAPELTDAIEAAPIPDPVIWDVAVRDGFLGILRAGDAGVRALDVLDRARRLERYVPAWRDVRCRPQRDPYHRFTVDAHLTETLVTMGRLLRSEADDELAAVMVNHIDHPDAVLLGALLHDIGKVGRGEHVPIGAALAVAQLGAMHVDAATGELAAFMVAEHLLLPDTATRRDLTDENLIMDVAARVQTSERLAALYLLAAADAVATGPAAWTSWRRTLVRELVAKVQRVFERGDMGRELAATLTERIGGVRELLASEPDADVDAFVLRMPRGYFLSVDAAQAARHFRTIAPPLGTTELRTTSAPGARPGTYELLVVAADRHGLLSSIAGALAIGGISILSAQAFTTDDRAAIDLFDVEGAFEPEITEARWRAFRTTLRCSLDGAISLERRMQEQRSAYRAPRRDSPVTVHVDNEASEFSTVIEVGAPDRIGLLHDITRTFAELELDVHLAKVTTFDGRVVDAFYVRDSLGRKVTEPPTLRAVEREMRSRLTG